ncbi:MAG: DUF4139 domain-containing protein [Sulfurovum sp.]|nr:DUF4139 domain-containing protein [Sulfurovum sp.]
MTWIIAFSLIAGTALCMASSLQVYQDRTLYRYTPKSTFIGLTQNIEAKCDQKRVSLESTRSCPSNMRLCTLFEESETLHARILKNRMNTQVLDQLLTLPQPQTLDAAKWVDAARKVGEEKSRLQLEKEKLSYDAQRLKARFAKQTRSDQPLETTQACKGELELTLPYGYVTFSTQYEAILKDDHIKVIQELSVLNQSGIDIEADKAHFYYRPAQQYLQPVHFAPWLVQERVIYQTKLRKAMSKRAMPNDMAEMAMVAAAPAKATYEDAREYSIDKLSLPSTGEPKTVPVVTWEAPLKCQTELFSYRQHNAFEVCSFKPKYQIEQHQWRVRNEEAIINEKAVGEYDKGIYRLYTQVDRDIDVRRQKVVLKERESGIFGGTVRKKDGYTLTLINKSDKTKKLQVHERIPTSTTEKIKVKLLSVKSKKPIAYKLSKEGELTMDIVLSPKETKHIEVLFEISYDKDLKITY